MMWSVADAHVTALSNVRGSECTPVALAFSCLFVAFVAVVITRGFHRV